MSATKCKDDHIPKPFVLEINEIPKIQLGIDEVQLASDPLEIKPVDVSVRLKELPSIRIHLPADFKVGMAVLGLEFLSVRLCGEAQVITEPYERNPCDVALERPGAGDSARAAKAFGEEVSGVKDQVDRASDQAIRAGMKMFQCNAEIVQHTLDYTAQLTSAMAERSFNQLGRAFRVSAEHADKGAQRSSTNMEGSSSNIKGPVQSGTIVTEMVQPMCVECCDIARARIERGFERMGALVRSRSPQDIIALQGEIVRDNLETFLGFARSWQNIRVV
jgi:hypothetical protein